MGKQLAQQVVVSWMVVGSGYINAKIMSASKVRGFMAGRPGAHSVEIAPYVPTTDDDRCSRGLPGN